MKKSKASVSKAFDRKTPLHPLASVADTYCAQRILISAHSENYQEDHIGFWGVISTLLMVYMR